MARKQKPLLWCTPLVCGQHYSVFIGTPANCPDLKKEDENSGEDEAATNWEASTISIRENLSDERKIDCLVHEVLVHGVLEASGIGRILRSKHGLTEDQWDALEEDLAILWSPALISTLKANDWLKFPKAPNRRKAVSRPSTVKNKRASRKGRKA